MMNINTANHKFLKPLLRNDFICIDATAGNGNDTLFLATNTEFVYAFDIQQEAEINTRKRLEACKNFEFILDSHSRMNDYVREKVNLVIFNLGYLPNNRTDIVTESATTIAALKQAMDLLVNGGLLSVACYISHSGGFREYEAVREWIRKNKLNVIYTYTNTERENSPVLFIIMKGQKL